MLAAAARRDNNFFAFFCLEDLKYTTKGHYVHH